MERAFSLANEAMLTIDLQRRRIRSEELEDRTFIFRRWADLQFFIVALRRLRRAAELARRAPSVAGKAAIALKHFDESLPDLLMMRNVGEHIEDYGVDDPGRRYKHVNRRMLQVGTFDETIYEWLGVKLNIDEAHSAAKELYLTNTRDIKELSQCKAEKRTLGSAGRFRNCRRLCSCGILKGQRSNCQSPIDSLARPELIRNTLWQE